MKTRTLILSIMFIAAAAFIARYSRPEIVPIREPLSGLPMRIGPWQGRQAPDMDPKIRALAGVDDYVDRVYYNSGTPPVSLYVGYYQTQREGDTIHSPMNCLPGAGWNPIDKRYVSISVDDNRNIEINRILIMKGADKQLVLYWYQSHGRVVASEYRGKIYTVLDALRTNRTDAALVRIISPVQNEMAAETNAIAFVKLLFPILTRFLPA
jgi:EpsI family protein